MRYVKKVSDVMPLLVAMCFAILFWSSLTSPACAGAAAGFILAPEGGRLDALDDKGQPVGPVPLKHTDVDVYVSGHFTRVNVTQHYHNPYDHKIEAVYTFPLSHRAAIDRMTMTVGDRVVQGEVEERKQARRIYEAARRAGHVSSLLEQERANIFTQSVANIEPGAEVFIEISYVEVLQSADGEYRFDFPMVVAPRYTPGRPIGMEIVDDLPGDVIPRRGIILPAPARIEGRPHAPADQWLRQYAIPIDRNSPVISEKHRRESNPRFSFEAEYQNGEREPGVIFADGVGRIADRWFFCLPPALPGPGEPFAVPTGQVPDADRVTPMPVKPDQRAGHDIGVHLWIDTGGPGITQISSSSHEIELDAEGRTPARMGVRLVEGDSIPNRDFRLAWRLESEQIEEAFLTHTGKYGDYGEGFFTLILQPPERVADEDARTREIIFVMDNSGSMRGARVGGTSALGAAKDVINLAIDAMRPDDRFNVVSFNNTLDVLWDMPLPNTRENRLRAQNYVDKRQGGGGTEMRNAVLCALGAGPFERLQHEAYPAGKEPMRIVLFLTDGLVSNDDAIIEAIRRHAHETRVFTIGMSHSPNRHLLDEMARVGRGAVDYVLPEDDVEPIVQRFADRIATPVLTDIKLEFSGGLEVKDVLPSPEHMPDLFDFGPLVIHGRYAGSGEGSLTITGRTGAGDYRRKIDIELPAARPEHDTIATLWAREKIGELMREGGGAVEEIVKLGKSFRIMSRHTSFVAVERQRVTVGGEPVLVRVPIEFPKGMSWEGIFGKERGREMRDDDFVLHMQRQHRHRPGDDRALMRRFRAAGTAGEVRAVGASPPAPDAAAFGEPGREAISVDVLGLSAGGGFAEAEGRGVRPRLSETELPYGGRVFVRRLPEKEPQAWAERLRELLHGEDEPDEALVRVVHDDSDHIVYILVPAPITGTFDGLIGKVNRRDRDVSGWTEFIEELRELLPAMRRKAELHRRLEQSLYERVMALHEHGAAPGAALQVAILLVDLDADTIEELEENGFQRLAGAESGSFVIGVVEPERLENLTLLDSVRRIEPARFQAISCRH